MSVFYQKTSAHKENMKADSGSFRVVSFCKSCRDQNRNELQRDYTAVLRNRNLMQSLTAAYNRVLYLLRSAVCVNVIIEYNFKKMHY